MFNEIKTLFPIFQKFPSLVYLDNAATTQRPVQVIEAINNFNSFENANIHRGVYDLSNQATSKYENTRREVAAFFGAKNPKSIAFTKGTTESINIIARSFLADRLSPGDNMVTTIMEHHANFIPWQMLAKEHNIDLRVLPVDKNGDLQLSKLSELIDNKTRMVAINHISNSLGTINEISEIISLAHQKDVPTLIDAAQSAAFYDLDSETLAYDFLVCSGHKMFGPFGVGILYTNEKYIDQVKPFNYGGGMIQQVTLEQTDFLAYPFHLEAGTPNISGVLGLSEAISFIEKIGQEKARKHIKDLTDHARSALSEVNEIQIVGNPNNHSGIISFNVKGIHPHDVASFLNKDDIAVRGGMHCTQPLLTVMGENSTVRASFSVYNSTEDIHKLIDSLKGLIKFWE